MRGEIDKVIYNEKLEELIKDQNKEQEPLKIVLTAINEKCDGTKIEAKFDSTIRFDAVVNGSKILLNYCNIRNTYNKHRVKRHDNKSPNSIMRTLHLVFTFVHEIGHVEYFDKSIKVIENDLKLLNDQNKHLDFIKLQLYQELRASKQGYEIVNRCKGDMDDLLENGELDNKKFCYKIIELLKNIELFKEFTKNMLLDRCDKMLQQNEYSTIKEDIEDLKNQITNNSFVTTNYDIKYGSV